MDQRWQHRQNAYGKPGEGMGGFEGEGWESRLGKKTAAQFQMLYEMSERLEISTPRLFCVLPSRAAMQLDKIAPRWLEPRKWNAGTFSIHPMCEWEGGHFLPSRCAYPLPDPQKNLRDMGSILHFSLEMLQKQLLAIEESDLAYSSGFVVPLAKLRKEAPHFVSHHSTNDASSSDDDEHGGKKGSSRTSKSRDGHDSRLASAKLAGRPFLFNVMESAIRTARARALAGSAAAAEAAVDATNYGKSLVHLEQFVQSADPLAEYGGLYQCEPAPTRHPDAHGAAPPKRCWLCAHHAGLLAARGGSVALGRTPPWAIGGLLYSLANRPFDAPGAPIAPPDVIERLQMTEEPPGVLMSSYDDTNLRDQLKSDRSRAKRRLRCALCNYLTAFC